MATYMIKDTRFMFNTHFSGNPKFDQRFHSTAPTGTIVIPDADMAQELLDMGCKVKCTRPYEDEDPNEFIPTYYADVRCNMEGDNPPLVHLVTPNGDRVKMEAEDMETIDRLQADKAVDKVNVVFSTWQVPATGNWRLYVRNMDVYQGLGNDPFASDFM